MTGAAILADLLALAPRMLLVALFLPFSAIDKTLNFRGAVAQAEEIFPETLAKAMILVGLAIEIAMPLCVLTGIADRAAAVVLAGYCGVTALLFKRFWHPGDFWQGSQSVGRGLFWDFLKNFALAGGFLLLALGPTAQTATAFLADPLGSTHPYAQPSPQDRP